MKKGAKVGAAAWSVNALLDGRYRQYCTMDVDQETYVAQRMMLTPRYFARGNRCERVVVGISIDVQLVSVAQR